MPCWQSDRLASMKSLAALVCAALALPSAAQAATVHVAVDRTEAGFQLRRAGRPYFVKGAGGDGDKALLARAGGNSLRTWAVGEGTAALLDEAAKLGLTVTLGLWLGHKEQGFDYGDAAAVARQLQEARAAVLRFKDHPALLLWAVGNELETNGNDGAPLWAAVQDVAKMIHEVDPHHPTMAVLAEIAGGKVGRIERLCPDIDVIGINTYAMGASLGERYREAGGKRPYLITEFGPAGSWEVGKNRFGAPLEPTSTEKAAAYRATYQGSVLGAAGLCLGSYAFAWGHKLEATATWFGLLLPDGSRLGAVDALSALWRGQEPPFPAPAIGSISLEGRDQAPPGTRIAAAVEAKSQGGPPLSFEWTLRAEQPSYTEDGAGGSPTASFPGAIEHGHTAHAAVTLPAAAGVYRLYATVRDGHGGAATANVPLRVTGPPERPRRPPARLPLAVFSGPYVASGWMGDKAALSLAPGPTSLRVEFKASSGWAGVAWQDPANDWGDKPGGLDLGEARALTFLARGAAGGEQVTFGYGLIGIDKRFHDSAAGKLEVVLTNSWQRYRLELAGRDLCCIKTAFYFTVRGQGAPLSFQLDGVQYEE